MELELLTGFGFWVHTMCLVYNRRFSVGVARQ